MSMFMGASASLRRLKRVEAPVASPVDYNTFGFDGDGSAYLDVSTTWGSLPEMTVSVWAKTSDVNHTNNWIVTKWGVSQRAFRLGFENGKCNFGVSTSGGNFFGISSSSLSNDTWYFLAGVFDGSNITVYVNGVADGSSAVTGSIYNSSAPLEIGKESDFGGGLLGDATSVLISSDDLSTYLPDLYSGGKSKYYETLPSPVILNLEGYYELSSRDDTGDDLSGNGRDLSSAGGVTSDGSLLTFSSYGY